jgi:sterol desaturase/sphingolipid hydroxylase (fatty acid hydroxylase superfamily)
MGSGGVIVGLPAAGYRSTLEPEQRVRSAASACAQRDHAMVRHAASIAIFPLLVVAMGAYAIRAPSLDLARRLGAPAAANDALILLSALLLFYPVIALLECWLPHRREWRNAQGDLRADVMHLLFTGAIANALFAATALGAAIAASAWLSNQLGAALWPLGWPPLAQLALAIAVAELGHYAFHRISHEQPLIWRLHATHHSAPRLYWLNATRFHVIDLFFLLWFQAFPLIALGADRSALLSYTIFAAVYGQLQHGNLELRTGPLDWIFSTPGLHRWHHSRNSKEGNHNYGAILSGWDLVFGSFWRPRGREFSGPLGIGKLPRFPAGYLGQQLSPLRWARIRLENSGRG